MYLSKLPYETIHEGPYPVAHLDFLRAMQKFDSIPYKFERFLTSYPFVSITAIQVFLSIHLIYRYNRPISLLPILCCKRLNSKVQSELNPGGKRLY